MACAGSASAQADNRWVTVSSSKEQRYAVNAATISRSGNILNAWFLSVFKGAEGEKGYDYTVNEYQIDCSARRLRMLQGFGYRMNGDVVDGTSEPGNWNGVAPESFGESMIQKTCNPTWGSEEGIPSIREYVQVSRWGLNH